MKVGDKVKILADPRNLTGEITSTAYTGPQQPVKFVVKFDDAQLIPPEMAYWENELEIILPKGLDDNKPTIRVYEPPKCECGLKYARSGGKHSDWCPLYKEWE